VSLFHAHTQGEWLVSEVVKKYPRADVLIHHDPVDEKDNDLDNEIMKTT
jgi:divalent metal cation (Fe/Co/Zn/Cd) transporter